MIRGRRLSICYVVPGHDLLATVGPSRNVVNLAVALAEWADVTVAFRRVADDRLPAGLKVLEIQPSGAAAHVDDAATRGIGYGEFYAYLKDIRRFTAQQLRSYDVVLEKSWLLSGYVSSLCLARGQLGVPVENIVADPGHAAGTNLMKRLRLQVGNWIAARALRRAPLIIAETEFLKREIVRYWRVRPEHVAVVDLGVDRTLFRSVDLAEARTTLGLAAATTILLYVGVLDRTHNLEPIIRAMGAHPEPGVELHVVGDGAMRESYSRLARECGASVVFAGRVPHADVPTYIGSADLCIAPYDPAAFSSGELGYSTMKIPEYLSVGRAVVSVPSGRISSLVAHGVTGFLFENTESQWSGFLQNLPGRERLREMGLAASRTQLTSWEDTARGYLSLCESQLSGVSRQSG